MHKGIIRCFDGKAQPGEPFWTPRDAAQTGGEPEIELYGTISEISWYEDDVTPQKFKDDLLRIGGGGPVTIRINSGGGDVIAASTIRSILRDYKGTKTVRIDGLAASAAVIIALAGDRIQIQDSAYMMIHDPGYSVFMAWLDVETMQGLINTLKPIKAGIADTYAAKTGLSVERINKLMSDETWMNAQKAVDLGFADEILTTGRDVLPETGEGEGSNARNANLNLLKNYRNVPAVLMNLADGNAAVSGDGADPDAGEDQNAPDLSTVATGEPGSEPEDEEVQSLRDKIQLFYRRSEK